MFVDVICFGNPGLGVTSFLGLPLFGHDFFSPLVVASESLAGSWHSLDISPREVAVAACDKCTASPSSRRRFGWPYQ